MRIFRYADLPTANLMVDAIYEGNVGGKLAGEALGRLLPVGNQGGFRAAGTRDHEKFVALYSSGDDPDWPDRLDLNTGQFVYYGDNKRAGKALHETPRGGNALLHSIFQKVHSSSTDRSEIPPCFVFQRYPTAVSARSFQFKGLAAPGYPGLAPTMDLVAVWKTSSQQRFQNYRAIFTILDEAEISRKWINDLQSGKVLTENCPTTWREWVNRSKYIPLTSENTTDFRSLEEQLPIGSNKLRLLRIIWDLFKDQPLSFEKFAACVFQMHDERVIIDEVTRGSIDGGRDAIGRYKLGLDNDPIFVEFALEAKCYKPQFDGNPANTVGVKETSRLISRIRHRQFGVLITTSAVARQAYSEIRDDKHPILIFSGIDIVDILIRNGFNTPQSVSQFITKNFT